MHTLGAGIMECCCFKLIHKPDIVVIIQIAQCAHTHNQYSCMHACAPWTSVQGQSCHQLYFARVFGVRNTSIPSISQ